MGELDGMIIGAIEVCLGMDTADLARSDDDEQFEHWLATVSIRDFERLLDDLLVESAPMTESSSGLIPAP